MTTIKIPVTMGKNRLRGNATGAMVDESDGGAHLSVLRSVLREEALAADVEPDGKWMSGAVVSMLGLYEQAHADWVARKDGTIGHVYEACMPSGRVVLMGDARTLARAYP
ncbi:MAG: hypothetical protein A2286_00060 [Gammaproteobacteria bacterium RIFOXYA12_FULL_61_12]|nr:MAG: hypothetical protein A2514_11410 [Gammaproteobacteria bacterium RIFOXYD12_FULL_61_37]OGT90761.1 MAG: hypothetical protein A2286_00060 [Gammaproteobacteria bacterium RIFOXYA12_FULL_61_12]